MANLSITLQCNRECSYCFSQTTYMKREFVGVHMSRTIFLRAIDFLMRSDINQVRLLGGEPTLHPDFEWFIHQALERRFRLLVFSNGRMPKAALNCLESTSPEQVLVLVNINSPHEQNSEENENQGVTLDRLGQRAIVGFNIYTPMPNMDFLLSLIDDHHLGRFIRLGLAHPCLDGSNIYLRPKDYVLVGKRVAEFVQKAEGHRVKVEFDCGFVPCMFPDDFLQSSSVNLTAIGQRCGPIPDILPDGSVVPCYPLASVCSLSLSDEIDAMNVRSQFDMKMQSYRTLGIFYKCATCGWKAANQCAGGCLAAAMQRLHHTSFAFTLQENTKAALKRQRCVVRVPHGQVETDEATPSNIFNRSDNRWVVPYVDQPLSFWEQLHTDFGNYIQEVFFPLPGEIIGSGRPPQLAKHMDAFLRYSPFPHSVLINSITLPRPVKEITPFIIETLRRLNNEFGLAGVTVSNLLLAIRIHERLPDIPLTSSVLMDIAQPNQARMIIGICDTLVPASRVMRDIPALQSLRAAFPGRIRLIVNEACLPGCPFRVQHFHEMGSGFPCPGSLCDELLRKHPWMRLTGAWVLPQHLHLYDGLYDELKLAGRVTLRNPAIYRRVLDAYVHRRPLSPDEIGGGPASLLEKVDISEEFFVYTLRCGHLCHECRLCQDYYDKAPKRIRLNANSLLTHAQAGNYTILKGGKSR